VKGPTPGKLKRFVVRGLGLGAYLRRPGDGRCRPQIPAYTVMWGWLVALVLRACSFRATEALVRSRAKRPLSVGQGFSNDTLSYFTERQAPERTREALCRVVRKARRNKAFRRAEMVGLAVDGTGACRTEKEPCSMCRPVKNAKGDVVAHLHHFAMASLVGVDMTLPVDVEPYGPGDSEYAASGRLLQRVIAGLGRRLIHYVVADGEYATAPFLHLVGDLGLHVVARLKGNLPELSKAAELRFKRKPPTAVHWIDGERVEMWDSADFDPWEALRWETVRVLRYRQHKRDGSVCEAYWLTDWSPEDVSSRTLYKLCKSRWGIENGGFNDGKNRYGMEHIHHHEPNSMLVCWLVTALAMTIERLFRVRFLHRGKHPVLEPIDLHRQLTLCLGAGLHLPNSS
jgi:hypothetical protein